MKKSIIHKIRFLNVTLLFIILITGITLAARFAGDNIRYNTSESSTTTFIPPLPDSTYIDSTDFSGIYDTAYTYSDGGDSVYVVADSVFTDSIFSDTSLTEGRFGSSGNFIRNAINYSSAKVGSGTGPIVCEPLFDGSSPELINKGLYGINVSGMFDNATCPNDGSATDQWDWLSDLRPEVLRFPHGSNGKFMHLLHDVSTGDTAAGYGYDIAELIRYFDASNNDNTDLVPGIYPDMATALATISTQSEANLAEWNTWMDNTVSGQFGKFLAKWQEQQQLVTTATDHRNYLTDFIKLIRQIVTDNPGHTVKIIVCLNILSETSAKCSAIVQFLRSNPIHNCTVVGVELGNECPSDFHWKVMGFAHFSEHDTPDGCDEAFNGSYWSFINGEAYETGDAQDRLDLFLNPAMQLQDAAGHYYNRDFIKAFKYNFLTSCKIGIPGEGTPNDELLPPPFFLLTGCPRGATEWNTDLTSQYGEEIASMPPGLAKKKFDAVILHIYLDDKQNWGPPIADLLLPYPYSERWDYASFDTRLQAAFNGILNFDPADPGSPASDSFMGFIKYGHKTAWDDYKTVFNFTPTAPTDKLRKELWMTEYNIKTSVDEDNLQRGVFTNGLTHGFVLQEWFLKNLKVNFASGYKKNFFTYATYQNYAGVGEDLITPADRPRELYNYLCKDYSPYNLGGGNPNQRDYYMKRTSYFIMSLLKEISAQDLKYVRTRYATILSNMNTMPTMFIDPGNDFLYMFYTNMKSTEQDYIINGENLAALFTPTPIISFGTATIKNIHALQLYSGSGNSTLFNPLFNTGYTNPTPADRTCYEGELLPPAYLYPIEIQTTSFSVNAPDCAATPSTVGGCITVPPYSIGYVKIPIQKNYRYSGADADSTNDITIYPNPANNWFAFSDNTSADEPERNRIEIYSITGILMYADTASENSPVDVSYFPSGIYLIKLFKNEKLLSVQSIVKTN